MCTAVRSISGSARSSKSQRTLLDRPRTSIPADAW